MRTKKLFMIGLSLLFCVSLCFAQMTEGHKEKNKEFTPEQIAKIKQAESLAERFVKRWHEVWDWKILDEEFYVKNPKQQAQKFGLNDDKEEIKNKGEEFKKFVKELYFFMNETFFLERELRLLYGEKTGDGLVCECPENLSQQREIFAAQNTAFLESFGELYDLAENEIKYRLVQFKELNAKYISLHKAHLHKDFSPSEMYQVRLNQDYAIDEDTKSAINRYSIPIDSETDVYQIRRGVFDFSIIEENGEMKVLWIDDGW